jgi:uncharacterized protein (DUF1501 family)
MASKNLIAINLAGGMDGINAFSYRDAPSVAFIQAARQSAPANVLNYTEAVSKVADVTKGLNTIAVPDVTGITTGLLVYGVGFDRSRKLTVSSISGNTLTLSGPSYKTQTGVTIYFATSAQMFKANETPALLSSTGIVRNPAFNQSLSWMADKFNTPDIVANSSEIKLAVVGMIGPLIRKSYKNSSAYGIYNLKTDDGLGGTRLLTSSEIPKNLTSHNDQQSTWQANAPEGAIKGWGGGIADNFIGAIPSTGMKGICSVSLNAGDPYTSGTVASTFNSSANSLLLQYPGYATNAWPNGKESAAVRDTLTGIIRSAAVSQSATDPNSIHRSVVKFNNTADSFQALLKNAPNITTPSSTGPQVFMKNLMQILRLMLLNNPNRKFVFTRSGNTVTAVTDIGTGLANRTAGSTAVTITSVGHGLFTSSTSTTNFSDYVLISGIDVADAANGYKITLAPGDENDKFTTVSTATTALVDAPITFRLKHNFTTDNKVFIKEADLVIDSVFPVDGFQVLSTPSLYSFTFNTVDSGAYSGENKAYAKLIDLDKQVFYTNTPSINWDTHWQSNTSALLDLDLALTYFNGIASRIVNANYVGFTITEFGRTYTTNSTGGTDHGWGNCAFVFGKDVKGNRVYGDALNYDPDGPHIGSNCLIPTTSVYQYGATLAKWIGSTDTEVIGLFPKIVNWQLSERYLGFL